ncbi:hypothetical protein Tco_0053886 [Tanacetum coccineum]
MAEPNNYITATQKNFVSNDNEGRMVEKCFAKIQGTFLEKIHNDAFNGKPGENAYEHINKFLDVVGPIKINGLTQDQFWLSIFPVSLTGAAYEWFTKECIGSITTWDSMIEKFIRKFHHLSDHNDDEDIEEEDDPNETNNAPKIFMIEGNLFDFETPLYEAFNEFNCLLKFDINLFTYDIQDLKTYNEYEQELNNDEAKGTDEPWSKKGVPYQLYDHICEPYHFKNGKTKWPTCTSDIDGFCNGGELPGMVRVGRMTYFQDHRWYDELADGKLKDETLALKAKIEGSWGDATPGVTKFCRWLKCCFENFHELECEVLVKLQECWWKVNAHEIALFTRMENFGRGPYANMKTEWVSNPYLDTNRIFGRDYEASNINCTQENQNDNRIPEPSNCKVRRFKMMKYSFNDDEEYITIKESEYLNHLKDSLDAYQELLRLIDDGWVVTTPDDE